MKQIRERQNEDTSLNAQYAARYYFNKAEIFNFLAWSFCLLSLLSALIPQTASAVILYGIPFLTDSLAALMILLLNKCIALGAEIRSSFDDYVFGFTDKLNMSQTLREYIERAIEKDPIQVDSQKKNTGKDIPPGVRNWYNTNSEKNGIDAIFSCQKENAWWEKKLFLPKTIFLVLATLTYIILLLMFRTVGNVSAFQIILSSALLLRTIERICENMKYFCIGNKIEGQIELLEIQKTEEQLMKLQSTINEKRNLKIVGMNFIYKLFSNKLSDIYEKTKD